MSAAMNENDVVLSEADDIAAMLPWYVSGRISAADKARIDAYASTHPDVMRHIAVAREEADAVFAANQAIEPPRAALDHALEKLHASIASEPRAKLYAVKTSALEQIGDWLSKLQPRQLAYACLAAVALFAVQAASIGALMSRGTGTGYEIATGRTVDSSRGSFALVAFQPAASAGALSVFFAGNNLTIVEGPMAGGVFRVRIGDLAMSDAAIADAIAKLKARGDLVSFAAAAPKSD